MKETQLYLVLTAGICHSVALSKRIATNFMLESILTMSNTDVKLKKILYAWAVWFNQAIKKTISWPGPYDNRRQP